MQAIGTNFFKKHKFLQQKNIFLLPILLCNLRKIVYNQSQSLKANNDRLSFSFAMVSKSCWWSYRLGGGTSFYKSDRFGQNPHFPTKNLQFQKIEPKNDILRI